ncbi:MAG: PhzF family phenazine biosynthesis protein [Gammaproteobacteria bacterium]
MQYEYYIADVFTTRIFQGAQVAVFPFADGLSQQMMQQIAGEMNLSETVFVFSNNRKKNKRRLRVFSPIEEIDFSGHPIIAAGWVLASIGDIELKEEFTSVVFEQNLDTQYAFISAEDGIPSLVTFTMPVNATVDNFVPINNELADILKLPEADLEKPNFGPKFRPIFVSCGKNYLIIPVKNYAAARKARFDFSSWSLSSAPATLVQEILIFTPTSGTGKSDFHGRLLGPEISPTEDLPIGSAMPAFTAYLSKHEHIKQGTHIFTIDRGTRNTRHSLLNIEMDNKPENLVIRVGGPAVMVAEGKLNIPD